MWRPYAGTPKATSVRQKARRMFPAQKLSAYNCCAPRQTGNLHYVFSFEPYMHWQQISQLAIAHAAVGPSASLFPIAYAGDSSRRLNPA